MLDNIPYITRISEPSDLDTAEYGTLCKVSNLSIPALFYMQTSTDAQNPRWLRLDGIQEEEALLRSTEAKKNLPCLLRQETI
jgi:hypothetical protein